MKPQIYQVKVHENKEKKEDKNIYERNKAMKVCMQKGIAIGIAIPSDDCVPIKEAIFESDEEGDTIEEGSQMKYGNQIRATT